MRRVAGRWSGALAALAQRHGAAFADLSRVYDASLGSRSPLDGAVPGLPPHCGGAGDLFVDPLRLSWHGAEIAAELLEEALRDDPHSAGPDSRDGQPGRARRHQRGSEARASVPAAR
jgi:hypothetical protein